MVASEDKFNFVSLLTEEKDPCMDILKE